MMQDYFAALKRYISEEKLTCQDPDAKSLLELLFNAYTGFNGFDNEKIRKGFAELYAVLNGKDLGEIDKIIDPVCTLCLDHEKIAFEEGVKVGVRLAKEIGI